MAINRRTALKQLGILTGGIMLLPGCMHQPKPPSISLRNIVINGDQEALLTDVVDTMIPAGEIPGAKALNVHEFVLRMVDDCQKTENQKIFIDGLADLDFRSQKQYDKGFSSLMTKQKESLLTAIEKESNQNTSADKKKTPPITFLSLTKKYTIQGYMGSEYVMTNISGYNMIPGRFDGCIPMKNKKIVIG